MPCPRSYSCQYLAGYINPHNLAPPASHTLAEQNQAAVVGSRSLPREPYLVLLRAARHQVGRTVGIAGSVKPTGYPTHAHTSSPGYGGCIGYIYLPRVQMGRGLLWGHWTPLRVGRGEAGTDIKPGVSSYNTIKEDLDL